MDGTLFTYSRDGSLPAFISNNHKATDKVVVLIGGLGDGLLSIPYTKGLANELSKHGWSLVIPTLSSSYNQFGFCDLDSDVQELFELVRYLRMQDPQEPVGMFQTVVLMGHSTGCQDSVWFMKLHGLENVVNGVILQAPVSDSEFAETLPETAKGVEVAQEMKNSGKEADYMTKDIVGDTPMTASRYLSLNARFGIDDMFSSYFSDSELTERLGHLAVVPTLFLLSQDDEFVPKSVNVSLLGARFVDAVTNGSNDNGHVPSLKILQGEGHSPKLDTGLAEVVVEFLTNKVV